MFTLGLIINPFAGIGGPAALKGSDGEDIVAQALARGSECRANSRAVAALSPLAACAENIRVVGFAGTMAGDAADAAGLPFTAIGQTPSPSAAEDTRRCAAALRDYGIDLLVFAGGDGTARDIVTAVAASVPVLGIPAGVKMHSGVYAISPQAAAELILRLLRGQLVDIGPAEVRDIDEDALRNGRVGSRYFGELLVPREGRFLQQVKSAGREVEALVIQDIGADLAESIEEGVLYLVGPGTTPSGLMQELGLDNTLLGVDAVLDGELIAADLDEGELFALLDEYPDVRLVVTATGGQGHLLGRGNQQLSPRVLRRIGLDNLLIVCSKTKLTELEGRPLHLDTGDAALDRDWSGYRQVITGYHDAVIYPLGWIADE